MLSRFKKACGIEIKSVKKLSNAFVDYNIKMKKIKGFY